jgi:DNA-binding transcriptional LysR family regulator
VSHATVLRRIDNLEKQLRVKLFKRLQSGYQLSDDGRGLYKTATDIEANFQKVYSGVQGNKVAGKIRVSQPTVGAVDLYSIYAEFIEQYPNIELEVMPFFWEVNLNRQEADVAIFPSAKPHELLVGRQVGRIKWQVYASKKYLARFEKPPSVADLRWVMLHRKLINITSSNNFNIWDLLDREVPHPKVVLQTQSFPELIFAVKEGLGATFMSDAVAHKFDDITRVPNCDMYNENKIWILTNRDLRNVERVRTFMQFVGDRLEHQLSPCQ